MFVLNLTLTLALVKRFFQGQPRRWGWAWLPCLLLTLNEASYGAMQVLDTFDEDPIAWTTVTAPGAEVQLSRQRYGDRQALRVDYDFRRGGGYVLVHKPVTLVLPPNYQFAYALRMVGADNPVEFRVVDGTLRDVWRKPPIEPLEPAAQSDWQDVTVKPHHLQFAWGPAGGGLPQRLGMIEFAVLFKQGGRGTLWLDDLRFDVDPAVNRPTAPATAEAASAQSQAQAKLVLDGDKASVWRSVGDQGQWLQIDRQGPKDLGGLIIHWDENDYARDYDVELSFDAQHWHSASVIRNGGGNRDFIPLPDAECRYLRLRLRKSSRGQGYAIREIQIEPYAFSATQNQFFQAVAADAPRGAYPQYFSGEQTYWTTVGTGGTDSAGDGNVGLLSEDGVFESRRGGTTIEPMLYRDHKLITWNDWHAEASLAGGRLPIPAVTAEFDDLTLRVEALASGNPGKATAHLRYFLLNHGDRIIETDLLLLLRPFQVVPPWQSVNMTGGFSSMRKLDLNSQSLQINDQVAAFPITPPHSLKAFSLSEGHIQEIAAAENYHRHQRLYDVSGHGSGLLRYRLKLRPGGSANVFLAVPLASTQAARPLRIANSVSAWNRLRSRVIVGWQKRLQRTTLLLPKAERPLLQTQQTALAHILISRAGPILRPGTRTYARAWIRDGAIISQSLLQFGHAREVREFIRWYSGQQRQDGHIPCCLDPWGPDAMVEHDAEGQYIFTLAEYFRYTRDRSTVRRLWPTVRRAVGYMEGLRARSLGPEYQTDERRLFYGLLPESASHEGYAARPVHAYWDDFWALRGLKDACMLAQEAGTTDERQHYAQLLAAFRQDVKVSIERTQRQHRIDYIPGAAELGDFDPSATAVAVTPIDETNLLSPAGIEASISRYKHERERQRDVYSPYEMRIVPALVHLHGAQEAPLLLQEFLQDQRPRPWHQWPEVLWRDYRAPRFMGDLPHAWISAEYLRAVRTVLAYEDEARDTLVLAPGVPDAWLQGPEPVGVRHLPTHYGSIDFTLRRNGPSRLTARIGGQLFRQPRSTSLRLNLAQAVVAVRVNGRPLAGPFGQEVKVPSVPAKVVIDLAHASEMPTSKPAK